MFTFTNYLALHTLLSLQALFHKYFKFNYVCKTLPYKFQNQAYFLEPKFVSGVCLTAAPESVCCCKFGVWWNMPKTLTQAPKWLPIPLHPLRLRTSRKFNLSFNIWQLFVKIL